MAEVDGALPEATSGTGGATTGALGVVDEAGRIVNVVRGLHELFDGMVGQLPDMPQEERSLRRLIARALVVRHVESVGAALALQDAGLGHLGVTFVRPALDAALWARYLAMLDQDDCESLLRLLSAYEHGATLSAMQQYHGRKSLTKMGFPAAFVIGGITASRTARDELGELGDRLGWPERTGVLPPMSWLANRVDRPRTYQYLYSATSKHLHFSVSDAEKQTYGHDGVWHVRDEDSDAYRTAFALRHLVDLFPEVLVAASELYPDDFKDEPPVNGQPHDEDAARPRSNPDEDKPAAEESLEGLFQELHDIGDVPIVIPGIYGLRPDHVGRRRSSGRRRPDRKSKKARRNR